MKRKQHGNGSLGERMAELFFGIVGWKMFRHQPPSRVVNVKGKPTVIYNRSDGIADYTGYQNDHGFPYYAACEVKEAGGTTMAASRLGWAQRAWMEALPQKCQYVGICWVNTRPILFEVFRFRARGSYRLGHGIRGARF